MTNIRFVIRNSQVWRGPGSSPGVEPVEPPTLIVTATTDELAAPGQVVGQLQVSIANADPKDFPAGKFIMISVH